MIEPNTCRALIKVIEDLQAISKTTGQGLVDDHCANAMLELTKALNVLINEWDER